MDDLREQLGGAVDQGEAPPGGEQPPLQPSDHWPQAIREKFSNADRDWQQFMLEREKQYQSGINQVSGRYQPTVKNWERLQEIIAPHRQSYQMYGMDDLGAIQYLMNLNAAIQQNPAQGIQYLAQRFGVDLAQLGQPQAEVSPEVQALRSQVAQLQGQLQQFGSEYQNTQLESLESQIVGWSQSKDEQGQPRYPFFEEVADDMLTIINGMKANGQPVTVHNLQDIYDRAVNGNPSTRSKIRDSEAKKADLERQRKAEQARLAGYDVRATGGAAKLAPSHDNIRAALEAAWPQ